MGMDLHGLVPTSEAGRYFHNNVWYWRPLANYIASIAPSIYSESWHFNDGAVCNASQALELASILQAAIDSGAVDTYAQAYAQRLNLLPDEQCKFCHGTGTRNDPYLVGTCNSCHGEGFVRPFDTNYPFSVQNVIDFAIFITSSGGFTID